MSDKPQNQQRKGPVEEYDVVVIGAGVSGMYALYHLRERGLSVKVYDGAPEVGGTWWHNGYPGARIDAPCSPYYCYTFSDELVQEWDWSERYSDQATILAYLKNFADKYDLRRDIQLETWIDEARYGAGAQRWTVNASTGERATAQFLICALGALSTTYKPDIPGFENFSGEWYHSGNWPHEPVSFKGKRVGVIGTGSTGVQVIPEVAKTAAHVTVFQRTPQYSVPARNRPFEPEELAEVRANWSVLREELRDALGGLLFPVPTRSALEDTPEQRQARYEEFWEEGGMSIHTSAYNDILTDEEANRTLSDFIRGKIREIVDDPETAEKLIPEHRVATKRIILDHGYYETYNRDNVTLVDLREDAIETVTPSGICTQSGEHQLDMIILATGYDAISGSALRLNPIGRNDLELKEKWQDGFPNYLGLGVSGFPNLFQIQGTGAPGVLYNVPLGSERQVEWIGDCISHMREQGLGVIEPTPDAEKAWVEEVTDIANQTLYTRTSSWYTGGNIPGKPRQFVAHVFGHLYFPHIEEVAEKGYEGFSFEPAQSEVVDKIYSATESMAVSGAG